MNINCIVVEDEPLAQERIKKYIAKTPYLNLLEVFSNPLKAMGFLRENKTDLLFLDIEMDELTGLELLESIEKPPIVIITSAYDNYALKGYELKVADYLLKPFTFNRFLQAVEHACKNLVQEEQGPEYIFLKTSYKIKRIALDDILFIEGMRDYRNVQTPENKILVLQTFGEFEEMLPKHKFCRVHKSYMVAISHIDFIERKSIQVGNRRIPISDSYKDSFYKLIGFPGPK
jgi:DNA-binding LytR/AlgR family response regulator